MWYLSCEMFTINQHPHLPSLSRTFATIYREGVAIAHDGACVVYIYIYTSMQHTKKGRVCWAWFIAHSISMMRVVRAHSRLCLRFHWLLVVDKRRWWWWWWRWCKKNGKKMLRLLRTGECLFGNMRVTRKTDGWMDGMLMLGFDGEARCAHGSLDVSCLMRRRPSVLLRLLYTYGCALVSQ